MRLKAGINVAEFLRLVESCRADVYLETEEDSLNLKSALSQYVFVVIEENEDIFSKARVICRTDEDYEILAAYLEA